MSRLRQKLVEMSRTGFAPSTPSKAPASPTSGRVTALLRWHTARSRRVARLRLPGSVLSGSELEFHRSVQRLLPRYLGQTTL